VRRRGRDESSVLVGSTLCFAYPVTFKMISCTLSLIHWRPCGVYVPVLGLHTRQLMSANGDGNGKDDVLSGGRRSSYVT
jgi:hypothetical protein